MLYVGFAVRLGQGMQEQFVFFDLRVLFFEFGLRYGGEVFLQQVCDAFVRYV